MKGLIMQEVSKTDDNPKNTRSEGVPKIITKKELDHTNSDRTKILAKCYNFFKNENINLADILKNNDLDYLADLNLVVDHETQLLKMVRDDVTDVGRLLLVGEAGMTAREHDLIDDPVEYVNALMLINYLSEKLLISANEKIKSKTTGK